MQQVTRTLFVGSGDRKFSEASTQPPSFIILHFLGTRPLYIRRRNAGVVPTVNGDDCCTTVLGDALSCIISPLSARCDVSYLPGGRLTLSRISGLTVSAAANSAEVLVPANGSRAPSTISLRFALHESYICSPARAKTLCELHLCREFRVGTIFA